MSRLELVIALIMANIDIGADITLIIIAHAKEIIFPGKRGGGQGDLLWFFQLPNHGW